jgi:ADP-heptose:LPS heptosyltransferase
MQNIPTSDKAYQKAIQAMRDNIGWLLERFKEGERQHNNSDDPDISQWVNPRIGDGAVARSSIQKPVVAFFQGLGDYLFALPALRALATLFPQQLTLVCMSGAREAFFSEIPFSTVYEVPFQRKDMHLELDGRVQKNTILFDADKVAANIKECDLFIALAPRHSLSVGRLCELLAPAKSIGFYSFFQTYVPLNFEKHYMDLIFDIPLQLDHSLQLDDFAVPLAPLPIYAQQAHALRSEVPGPWRVMAVHADSNPKKMWPADRFVELLDLFLSRHPEFIVFVVGAQDLHLDVGQHGRRIIPCYNLPLPLSLALIGEVDLFLGVDSCMLHAADLFRIPGVGLFGPLFGPASHIKYGFRLVSSYRHVCGESMDAISTPMVAAALEALLEENAGISKGGNISV